MAVGSGRAMRRIGLVGGTSWVSTLDYYRLANELVAHRLGRHHSADLVVRSLDLQPLLDALERPTEIVAALRRAVDDLLAAGAELVAFASVTGHHFGDTLGPTGDACFLHVADATAPALARHGAERVGVLGTRITLANDSLVARLVGTGVVAVLPPPADQQRLDDVIFGELMYGRLSAGSRATLDAIIDDLCVQDVDRVLLACTELTSALPQLRARTIVDDATQLHCAALVAAALEDVAE